MRRSGARADVSGQTGREEGKAGETRRGGERQRWGDTERDGEGDREAAGVSTGGFQVPSCAAAPQEGRQTPACRPSPPPTAAAGGAPVEASRTPSGVSRPSSRGTQECVRPEVGRSGLFLDAGIPAGTLEGGVV